MIFIIKHDQEGELIILWTSGVKKISFVNIFFLISILVTLIYLLFSVFLTPLALNKSRELLSNDKYNSLLPTIKKQIFTDSFKGFTFFVEQKNGNEVKNIFLHDKSSILGKLSPITGGFITEKSAVYLYTGAQTEYDVGSFTITPSFAPGYYNFGDGKDLGHALEFKSEVQVSFNFSDTTEFGMSYNHISNASLGTKNPGANSYMFNFLKQF